MKKALLFSAALALIILPSMALGASLSTTLRGKILLAVEDHGKTYYVHEDGKRYRVTKDTAQRIFEELALGISNSDLSTIPEGSVGISPESQPVKAVPQDDTDYKALYADSLRTYNNDISIAIDAIKERNSTISILWDGYLDASNNFWDLAEICTGQSEPVQVYNPLQSKIDEIRSQPIPQALIDAQVNDLYK